MRSCLPHAAGPLAIVTLAVLAIGGMASLEAQEPSRLLPRQTVVFAASPSAPAASSPGGVGDARSPAWQWSAGTVPFRPQAAPVDVAKATALSALLPGAGQHLLGQRRKWVYLALEAAGWLAYADRRAAAGDFRDEYRDFAWERARIQQGGRVDGDFDYYESLTKWDRSGAFDLDGATSGVQPETDVTTYNGSIWALASQLFLTGLPPVPPTDPQYQRALDYYGERAYGSEFLWDWTGTGPARDEYGDLIRSSDDRFRQATNLLGAVIANHVVSAVDAFLSARGIATGMEAGIAPLWAPHGFTWQGVVRLPLPGW